MTQEKPKRTCLIDQPDVPASQTTPDTALADPEAQEKAVVQLMNRMKRIPFPRLYPDLSPAEADLLTIVLRREGGERVSAIAKAMDLPMSAVSRLLRGMEERGLIERSILPQDRRSIVVTVTPEGERIFLEMRECIHTFLAEALENVDPVEFQLMISEWNALMDRMEMILRR